MAEAATRSLTEQRRLLEIEYLAERDSFRRLTDRIGVVRLVERGYAWMPLRIGRTWYNSLNQLVVEVWREDDGEDSAQDHNFEYGRPVQFFTLPETPGAPPVYTLTGTVSYVDGSRMVIGLPDGAQTDKLYSTSDTGVMLSFDETTYRAMFEAIDRTISAKGRLGELRDMIYSPARKASVLSFDPMGFGYLNPAQEKAVNAVLRAKDVAVVHGPPGTGKTTTLVEAIYETLRRESQVMVCAQSNMAVDWISEKLVDRGINVLRIGNPSRVCDKMLSFTYERQFEAHPEYPELWSIRKAMRELSGKRRNTEQWHQKMDRLKSRATGIELRINAELFGQARVIASTLVGSNSHLLDGMRFSTLFIDEAAQALEAACWIAARRAGRIVLAGDHCQLPPTVKSYEAMKGGLGRSLMERVAVDHPETVNLLTMQYRMHEDIMRFSNEWFYNGLMTAAPDVRYRGILDYDNAVEWIDTSEMVSQSTGMKSGELPEYREALAGESHGRINRDEAQLTVEALEAYFTRIGMHHVSEERIDTGVISPYRAQAQYLRKLIRRSRILRQVRELITVNTIDGFQGQERDVIVISLVRSNDDGQIGFLRDLRRMNVAMTRARMKLIIIGNSVTLGANPFYRRLYDYIKSRNDY